MTDGYLSFAATLEHQAVIYLQRAADYRRDGNEVYAAGCELKALRKFVQATRHREALESISPEVQALIDDMAMEMIDGSSSCG